MRHVPAWVPAVVFLVMRARHDFDVGSDACNLQEHDTLVRPRRDRQSEVQYT